MNEDDLLDLLRRALSAPGVPPPVAPPADARPAAVLVPVLLDDPARVVMHVRSRTMREHAGEVAFAGGRPDPGDADLRRTAEREAEEEMGLAPSGLVHLGELAPIPVITGRYLLHPFVAAVRGQTPRVASSELERLVDVPLLPWLEGEREVRATLDEWRGLTFPTPIFYLDGGDVLYGASAAILYELLARLAAARGKPLPPLRMQEERPWGDRYARDRLRRARARGSGVTGGRRRRTP